MHRGAAKKRKVGCVNGDIVKWHVLSWNIITKDKKNNLSAYLTDGSVFR